MRAPKFWDQSSSWQAIILAPLGHLYAAATARRLANGSPLKLKTPVVCIGNINAGGTGKTPTVIAVTELLRDLYHTPHIVSRGYGGTLEGPVRVDPAIHNADHVGDEPLLLAAFAEVWVSKDRALGGKAAQDAGATVIVLDDGHQNPALHKDLSIVVVDAQHGFGNGQCLPAGPLREPLTEGLSRADLLLSIGLPSTQETFATSLQNLQVPHISAALEPLMTGMDWADTRAFAFAGIGHPEKFFATLRGLGAEVVHTEPLDDHQKLSTNLLARFEADARVKGAQLVTTEKDAVRLPPAFRMKVITLPVRLKFEDDCALQLALKRLPLAK